MEKFNLLDRLSVLEEVAVGILSCFCAVYSFIICVLMKDIKIRLALFGLTVLNIIFALMNFSNAGVIK